MRSEIARLSWAHYMRALHGSADEKRQSVTYSTIRSSGHQVSTLQMTKTGLCAYDDKRYVLGDNVHTLAHGHWRTQQMSAHAAHVALVAEK